MLLGGLAAGVRGLSGAVTMERSEDEKQKFPDRINLDRKGLHGMNIQFLLLEIHLRIDHDCPKGFRSWRTSRRCVCSVSSTISSRGCSTWTRCTGENIMAQKTSFQTLFQIALIDFQTNFHSFFVYLCKQSQKLEDIRFLPYFLSLASKMKSCFEKMDSHKNNHCLNIL